MIGLEALEVMAQDLAKSTGAPLEVARDGIRLELAKLTFASGREVEANDYAAILGYKIRKGRS